MFLENRMDIRDAELEKKIDNVALLEHRGIPKDSGEHIRQIVILTLSIRLKRREDSFGSWKVFHINLFMHQGRSKEILVFEENKKWTSSSEPF